MTSDSSNNKDAISGVGLNLGASKVNYSSDINYSEILKNKKNEDLKKMSTFDYAAKYPNFVGGGYIS